MGRATIAAVILLSLVGCLHQSEGTRQLVEFVGGIAYLGAKAFQVFMLVP